MLRFTLNCLLVSLLILHLERTCLAQTEPVPGIQGNGSDVVERLPERMRMAVSISVTGKDLAEAIEKLKAQRTKIEQQLKTLGAVKGSEIFSPPKLDDNQNNERKRMEELMRMKMMQARGGKAPKKVTAAKPVVVAVKLTADWQLTTTNEDDLFLESQKLQEAINAADIAGTKASAAEKSAEEEELAEESTEMTFNYGMEQPAKPGVPAFTFLIKVTNQEYEQALAKAFQAASKSASQLAQAAGVPLGSLRHLRSTAATDSADAAANYRMIYSGLLGMPGATTGETDATGPREAIVASAEKIRYRVMVAATFDTK